MSTSANPFVSSITLAPVSELAQEDKITYYTYRHQSGDSFQNMCMAMALIESFNAGEVDDYPPGTVACYVVTVTNLLVPGFVDQITRSRKLSVNEAKDDYSVWNVVPDDDIPTRVDPSGGGSIPMYTSDPTLETEAFGLLKKHPLFSKLSNEVVGGRWGIEMFPIGKSPATRNITAFTVNRPRAVQEKYSLTSDQRSFFAESFGPTLAVLKKIEQVFTIYPTLRYQCAQEWMAWVAQPTSRVKQAFVTTFRLTDGSGFSSAAQINKLLVDHPLVAEFPGLKSECQVYRQALDAYLSQDSRVRGFAKVLWGNDFALFKSSSRGALLALAIIHARSTNNTMAAFLDTSSYSTVLSDVNEFLKSKKQPTIMSKIAGGAEMKTGIEI